MAEKRRYKTPREPKPKRLTAKQKEQLDMARSLLVTNLAWRVELVRPSAALDELLIATAKKLELAQKALPLLLQIRRTIAPDHPALAKRVLYTQWGLKELEALAAAVGRGQRGV